MPPQGPTLEHGIGQPEQEEGPGAGEGPARGQEWERASPRSETRQEEWRRMGDPEQLMSPGSLPPENVFPHILSAPRELRFVLLEVT